MIGQGNPWHIQSIYEFQYFNCPICVYKDQSKQDFVNHAFQDHPESISSLLNIGDSSLEDVDFPTKIKAEDDPLAPTENDLYQEEIEDQDNEEKVDFEEFEAKSEKLDFKCEVCSECFEDGQLLLEHVDSLHKKSNIDDEKRTASYEAEGGLDLFECDICREPFRTKGRLAKHLRTSHQSGITTICDSCGTKFDSSEEKDIHRIYCISPETNFDSKNEITVEKKIKKLPKKCKDAVQNKKELPQKVKSRKTQYANIVPRNDKVPLECNQCEDVFKTYYKLVKHVYDDHHHQISPSEMMGTFCNQCNKEFPDCETLREHLFVNHNSYCIICSKNFDSSQHLMMHLIEDHKRIHDSCTYCGIFLDSGKSKLEHMKNCSEKYKCALCPYGVGSYVLYVNHIRLKHWNEDVYRCDPCNKTFTVGEELKRHIQKIHEKKDLSAKCDLCGKVLASKSSLYTHMKNVHEKVKKHTCEKCGFQVPDKHQLRHHIQQVHEKQRNIQCDQCGKEFYSRVQHNRHYRAVHENDIGGPNQCHRCELSFWTKSKLDKHIKQVHDSFYVKKFKCDKCEKSFSENFQLLRHTREMHENKEIVKCNECGKEFGRMANLNIHIKTVHRGIKDFKCEHCGMEFVRKKKLEQHLEICLNSQ